MRQEKEATLASRREGSHVVRRNGMIEKYYPHDFKAELEKHRLIAEALSDSDIVFPALISEDGIGRLVMEDLGDLISLRETYLNHMKAQDDPGTNGPELMHRAGAALALIHAVDPVKVSTPHHHSGRVGPDEIEVGGDRVMLHGDYGFSNVFVQQRTGKLAIIDPSPNHFVTTHPLELGPPSLDLGNFTSCLMGLVPPRNFLRMRWYRAAALIEKFLSGYEITSGRQIASPHLMDVTESTARAYFSYKYAGDIRQFLANVWFRTRRKKIEADFLRLQA